MLFQFRTIRMVLSLLAMICVGTVVGKSEAYPTDLQKGVDLIIFSYRRPLQLDALLRSINQQMKGLNTVSVIFKVSEPEYQDAYQTLQDTFVDVNFVQEDGTEKSFKSLLCQLVENSKSEYVMLGVDDLLVKDTVDLRDCTALLALTNAYGFYLRLGDHVDYCYSVDRFQGIPPLTHPHAGVCQWQFNTGLFDWHYPHTTDMTIFRKKDLLLYVQHLSYQSPNSFEANWAMHAVPAERPTGICFDKAAVVSLPMNKAGNEELANRITNNYSTAQLLDIFNRGLTIDLKPLEKIVNRSAHMDYNPTFIKREAAQMRLCENEKRIVIVTASYNNAAFYRWNLDSVFAQRYENYHLIYYDDGSTDGTYDLVADYVRECGQSHRVTVIRSEVRSGSPAENHYKIINTCDPHDIIIILDGDDRFAHYDVLSYINTVYEQDIWLTYGQYKEYPSGDLGHCRAIPQDIIDANDFNKFPFVQSHLRTFYAGLFQLIRKEDLMCGDKFLPMSGDVATMLPMCQMARKGHFKFIPDVLLEYNAVNPISEHRISQDLQFSINQFVRTKRTYQALRKLF